MRQALLPVGMNETFCRNRIDVRRKRQGHDVGLETVDDRPRLFARTAVRLLDRNRLSGLGLPVFCKRCVEILVELACRIIGNVEQRSLRVRLVHPQKTQQS